MSLTSHFDTSIRLRTPVELIRDELNGTSCMSFNPFLCQVTRYDLMESMTMFSADILNAARLLADKMKVFHFDRDAADNDVSQTAEGIADAGMNAERDLLNVFNSAWTNAHDSLVKLAADPASSDLANNAMQSFQKLYTVVRAVPEVYNLVPHQDAVNFMFRPQEMHA